MGTVNESNFNSADLPGWTWAHDHITATFATGDFMSGLALVTRIAAVAEAANHHPDVTLTYPSVGITLTSHDVDAVTDRDLDLARQINEQAKAAGVDHG